ncbi:hypothetical protein ABPG74_002945 [Tetrahymena malaccensis]
MMYFIKRDQLQFKQQALPKREQICEQQSQNQILIINSTEDKQCMSKQVNSLARYRKTKYIQSEKQKFAIGIINQTINLPYYQIKKASRGWKSMMTQRKRENKHKDKQLNQQLFSFTSQSTYKENNNYNTPLFIYQKIFFMKYPPNLNNKTQIIKKHLQYQPQIHPQLHSLIYQQINKQIHKYIDRQIHLLISQQFQNLRQLLILYIHSYLLFQILFTSNYIIINASSQSKLYTAQEFYFFSSLSNNFITMQMSLETKYFIIRILYIFSVDYINAYPNQAMHIKPTSTFIIYIFHQFFRILHLIVIYHKNFIHLQSELELQIIQKYQHINFEI